MLTRPSKPLTPVRHPPTDHGERNRGRQRPPERQDEIGEEPEQSKDDPENLAFHGSILGHPRNGVIDPTEHERYSPSDSAVHL